MQDTNKLLDALISRLSLKNDAALSRALEVAPPVLSKVRNGKLPVGPALLCKASLATGLNIAELQALM